MAKHRKAVLPAEEPRFLTVGKRRKGSVRRETKRGGYMVVFSYIIGDHSTFKVSDLYWGWNVAMSEYREHDRMVQEKMLEQHSIYLAKHAVSE